MTAKNVKKIGIEQSIRSKVQEYCSKCTKAVIYLDQAEFPVPDDDDGEKVGGSADQDDGEQEESLAPVFEPREAHLGERRMISEDVDDDQKSLILQFSNRKSASSLESD